MLCIMLLCIALMPSTAKGIIARVNVNVNVCPCNFASVMKASDPMFVKCMAERQSAMLTHAYWGESGLTKDGLLISARTGMPLAGGEHNFSAPSKESLHLGLLALAIQGGSENSETAMHLFSSADQNPLEELEKKMTSYERWNSEYPGYGGWLPWFTYNSSTGMQPTWDWQGRVPSLDNGEMFWALTAVSSALHMHPQRQHQLQRLQERVDQYIALLKSTAVRVFYAGQGRMRTVTLVGCPHLDPFDPQQNYSGEQPCGNPCYLLDPYEGELFVLLADLYGNWSAFATNERMLMWEQKRAHVVRTSIFNMTVQQGWWYSSHEAWKYMMLPYTQIPIQRKMFVNQERARLTYSVLHRYPGLFASVTNVSFHASVQQPPRYLSSAGVAPVANQSVSSNYVVTPYATFPMMLLNRSVALRWYRHMLLNGRMQGPMGSTAAVSVDGKLIAPVVTWDSSMTSLLAALGGLGQLNRFYMMQQHVASWQLFQHRIGKFYEETMGPIWGYNDEPFPDPEAPLPSGTGNFCDSKTDVQVSV